MKSVNSYTDWLNQVTALGAVSLLQETTPNSSYNILYAEKSSDKIVGNWHKAKSVGWIYDPMKIDKTRRKFKKTPLNGVGS